MMYQRMCVVAPLLLLLIGEGVVVSSAEKTQGLKKFPRRHEKMRMNFGKHGHQVTFCMDGETCRHLMRLKLNRLYEVDLNGTDVGNKAQHFRTAEYTWARPEYILNEETGANTSTRVRLDANVLVGNKSDDVYANFSMITEIFYENATIQYANDSMSVTNGSFKFSVNITNWPWKDNNTENRLSFGVRLQVKTRKGKRAPKTPERRARKEGKIKLERMNLGDEMFLDSPSTCVVDYDTLANATTSVDASIDDENDGIAIDWTFPHFETNLYYDPVMGDNSDTPVEEENGNGNAAKALSVSPILLMTTTGLYLLFLSS